MRVKFKTDTVSVFNSVFLQFLRTACTCTRGRARLMVNLAPCESAFSHQKRLVRPLRVFAFPESAGTRLFFMNSKSDTLSVLKNEIFKMMFLAQQMSRFDPPVTFAAWTACAFFAVALFNALSKAWFTLRGKPTPAEAKSATDALEGRIALIEKCIGSCKVEQDRRLDALEKGQAHMQVHILDETSKLYNRVNASAEAIAEVRGELRVISSQMSIIVSALEKNGRQ